MVVPFCGSYRADFNLCMGYEMLINQIVTDIWGYKCYNNN